MSSRSRAIRASKDRRLPTHRRRANRVRATNSSSLGSPAPGGARSGSCGVVIACPCGRTAPTNDSRLQNYPHGWASSRVHCIGWFDSGRVIDPIVLDGATLPEGLHSGRDHRRVPFRPCEGNQSIFVTPTADHGVGIWRPSRWHPDLARQITRRLLYGIDRQRPKPGLKGGSRDWINLDTKDAKDHRKTGERRRSAARDHGIIHTAGLYRESAASLRSAFRVIHIADCS
jgi:hypothetical protein